MKESPNKKIQRIRATPQPLIRVVEAVGKVNLA